jgi:hypothetical protein
MTLLNKFGIGGGHGGSRGSDRSATSVTKAPTAVAVAGPGSSRAPEQAVATRVSNGLKEFLWNLDGLGHGTLLDLGPAWQTTLNFFIERGFRVSSEDVLRGWKTFLDEDEARLAILNSGDLLGKRTVADYAEMKPAARAARFLETNLRYPVSSFDAVLLWDLLDYLDPAMTTLMIDSITHLLRPAGIVFAMFHSKKPEGFQRYRVADSNTLQVIPSSVIFPAQKVYQNREIQTLFSQYRTLKSFVSRDQLRENLIIK